VQGPHKLLACLHYTSAHILVPVNVLATAATLPELSVEQHVIAQLVLSDVTYQQVIFLP
jgi:hypothetical protein